MIQNFSNGNTMRINLGIASYMLSKISATQQAFNKCQLLAKAVVEESVKSCIISLHSFTLVKAPSASYPAENVDMKGKIPEGCHSQPRTWNPQQACKLPSAAGGWQQGVNSLE